MSFWNPVRMRQVFSSDSGLVATEHGLSYNPQQSMGAVAESQVGTIVEAGLVGMLHRMHDLCPRCIEWIDRAIVGGEKMAGETEFHHQHLLHAKGLAMWLWVADPAQAIWSDLFERRLRSMRAIGPRLTGRWRGCMLDDLTADAYQSGRFAEGVAAYEEFTGSPASALKPSRVASPRQVAALLCARGAGAPLDDAAVHAAGRRMLQKRLAEDWLHNGQLLRSAMWLKIVHWHPGSELSPQDVLLKAYDDMPTIARPEFLAGR